MQSCSVLKASISSGCGRSLIEYRLCPNCARQGQIFPNGSKRNQKPVEKVEWIQLLVITSFLNFKNPGLRILRPQVERQRNPVAVQAGFKFILCLSMDPAPDDRDFTSYLKNLKVFNGCTMNSRGLQISVCKPFLWACFGLVVTHEWDGK